MPLSLRVSAVSEVGRRQKNDDSGYAGTHFVMVADGMGGAPYGDVASSVTIQTMQRLDTPAPDDLLEALAGAVHRANDRLAEVIEEDAATDGMGTTVTAALFDGSRIGLVHIGDSRGYLWRDGSLRRLTQDHSWVQSLVDEGRITEEEAATHSHRSLVLKVLDGRHETDPDLDVLEVEAGDRLLLCSDGLSGFVDQDSIERVLSTGTADSVVRELTRLALEHDSNDNITVVVADVVDEPALKAEPVVVGAAAEEVAALLGRHRSNPARSSGPAHSSGATSVESLDDEEEVRYAPREPPRWLGLRRLVTYGAVAAVLVTLGAAGYDWTQNQYYVGSHNGRVAIYRGVEADIPGLEFTSVVETANISVDELPSFRQSEVLDGLDASDLGDARRIVATLETFARDCAPQRGSTQGPDQTQATSRSNDSGGPDESTGRSDSGGDQSKPAESGGQSDSPDQSDSSGPSRSTKDTDSTRGSQQEPTSGDQPRTSAPGRSNTRDQDTTSASESTGSSATTTECARATTGEGTTR